MLKLSLCMIVRDEEANLERCVRSTQGVVDEVCVLDTGSQDRTLELAQRLGARVARAEWSGDFAAARNASLALATGDWILVLDADEELDLTELAAEELRARLIAFASGAPERAGRVRVRNRLDAGDTSEADIVRFFRRDSRGCFEGRIHEQWTLAGELPPRADTGIFLVHHGYACLALERRGKLARNLALLASEVEARPEDGYAWYQYGRTLSAAGQSADALCALETALGLASDRDDWAIHALELGGLALRALGRFEQARGLVEGALELAHERTDTRFLAALLALDCGDVQAAEAGFRTCLAQGPARAGVERSAAAGGWAAAYNLAVICEHTGRAEEAAALYRSALAQRPDEPLSAAGLERLGGPLPRAPAIR
ncbi:MAG: glycosyltransferase [Planctomycetes bacterium]|nr:glycosyltransferase [Planctomycetota bacterium]